MEIQISEIPNKISQISKEEYNVAEINSIAERYKELRQRSKAPTFRTYLWRNIPYLNEKLWF